MVKRRDVGDLRPPHLSGLTQRCVFIATVIVGLLLVIDQAFSKKPQTTNGICGSAEGVATSTAPTSGLCSSGTASLVSGGNGSPWTWSCTGSGARHTNASCSAPFQSGGGGGGGSGGTPGQKPGPSADLFNSPYYHCVNNYFVATSGSDSNDGRSAPWLTLQHADDMNVGAGSCINVAPGTYDGVLIHNGGNASTATGYVTYRCQQLDACTITGNGGVNGSSSFDTVRTTNGTPPNFVQIDGFEMVGQGTFYPVGVEVFNGDNSTKVASHHIWVLNSIIHGFGQSGIGFAASEYLYAIHNTAYGNANTTCDAQGSGIAMNIAHTIPGYVPTADDQTNPNPLLGPTWQVGSSFFHVVFEYNVTYNNALTRCGTPDNPVDTDGNGIIFDTNAGFAGNPTNYTAPMLAAFNVTYNNGGGGVHVFRSTNVTVANNSCFNNYIDPASNGAGRACIDEQGGSNSTFINNLAEAIPATVSRCQFGVAPYTQWNNAFIGSTAATPLDTFSHNISDMVGVSCWGGDVATFDNGAGEDTYSATANKENTTIGWVDVGSSSLGSETSPPVGHNFALQPTSPAIGYGLTEPYLPASSVDAGACASALTTCP